MEAGIAWHSKAGISIRKKYFYFICNFLTGSRIVKSYPVFGKISFRRIWIIQVKECTILSGIDIKKFLKTTKKTDNLVHLSMREILQNSCFLSLCSKIFSVLIRNHYFHDHWVKSFNCRIPPKQFHTTQLHLQRSKKFEKVLLIKSKHCPKMIPLL